MSVVETKGAKILKLVLSIILLYKGTGEEPKALHDDSLWTFLAVKK